jgi:membrane peptidoglycan carboxypeptidase
MRWRFSLWILHPQRLWQRIPRRWRVTTKVSLSLLLLFWWTWAAYVAYLIQQAKNNTPSWAELYEWLKNASTTPTSILDIHGAVLAAVSEKNEYDVAIEDMNPYLVASLIAVEDERFWEHNGFDTQAIWWMIRDNLFWSQRGGSTLWSWLFKETPPEKTGTYQYMYDRWQQKIREWVKAGKLFSLWPEAKWFALEWYLNNTYFVTNEKWIAAAAQIIFNEDQGKLTLDQCALIVGLANNPAEINPLSELVARRQAAERRTDKTLGNLSRLMQSQGVFHEQMELMYPDFFVTQQQIATATDRITIDQVSPSRSKVSKRKNSIPHATSDILNRAQSALYTNIWYQEDDAAIANLPPWSGRYKGIVSRDEQGNLDTLTIREWWFNVITTLDGRVQDMMMGVLVDGIRELWTQRKYPAHPLDGAVICIENETWNILADVRGIDRPQRQFDFRHAQTEQWSIMKSVVMAVALELDIIDNPEQIYLDSAITLTSTDYAWITSSEWRTPSNFSSYSGDSLAVGKSALVDSRNTSMAYLFQQAAHQWKWEIFMQRIYEILGMLTPGRYKDAHSLHNNPQIWLWLIPVDLDMVAAMYMALANWWSIPQDFTDIVQVTDTRGWLLYVAEPVEMVQIYDTTICNELLPYLLEKGKQVTGRDNILAKSWTTWQANKLRLVAATPKFTMVMRVWPLAYTDDNWNILGFGDWVDATTLLAPLMRKMIQGLEQYWYYHPWDRF